MDRSDDVRRWGPDRRLVWISLAAALACALWGAFRIGPADRLVAAVSTASFLIVALLLVRVRVRLIASRDGVTVIGPLHRRYSPWSEIAAISTPTRGRFGRRSAVLEIEFFSPGYDVSPAESGTDLIVFGSLELGGDPAAAGRVLTRLHRAQ